MNKQVPPLAGPAVDYATRRVTTEPPANSLNPSPVQAAARVHDKATMIMDAKWGTDVLPTLVSPQLAAKFTRASCRRDASIETGTEAEIVDALNNVVLGLKALDTAATEAGVTPLKVDRSWSARSEQGRAYVFVQSEEDARMAARSDKFKGYLIFSIPEVIRVLEQHSLEAVLQAKNLWPESSVVTPRPAPVDWLNGDEVPF